jgi:uncharacterized protein
MKPRITVLTLGVDDLEAAVRFYREGLGLPTQGIIGTEFEFGAVAFFELAGGLRLALWPRTSIAADTGLAVTPPSTTELTIGHNVRSREAVDTVMAQAPGRGRPDHQARGRTFYGGYAGYFQDPDGHLWEATWNPAFEVED